MLEIEEKVFDSLSLQPSISNTGSEQISLASLEI